MVGCDAVSPFANTKSKVASGNPLGSVGVTDQLSFAMAFVRAGGPESGTKKGLLPEVSVPSPYLPSVKHYRDAEASLSQNLPDFNQHPCSAVLLITGDHLQDRLVCFKLRAHRWPPPIWPMECIPLWRPLNPPSCTVVMPRSIFVPCIIVAMHHIVMHHIGISVMHHMNVVCMHGCVAMASAMRSPCPRSCSAKHQNECRYDYT